MLDMRRLGTAIGATILIMIVVFLIVLGGYTVAVTTNSMPATKDLEIQTLREQVEYTFMGRCRHIIDKKKKLPDNLKETICNTVLVASINEKLDPFLVLSHMGVESGFKPYAVSPAGALGLLQVMPFWAKEYGLQEYELWNPVTNIIYGTKIMAHYQRICGKYSIECYVRGPGGVQKVLQSPTPYHMPYTDAVKLEYRGML